MLRWWHISLYVEVQDRCGSRIVVFGKCVRGEERLEAEDMDAEWLKLGICDNSIVF